MYCWRYAFINLQKSVLMMETTNNIGICFKCGVKFERKSGTAKFCPDCRKEAERERNRRYKRKVRAKIKREKEDTPSKPKHKSQIDSIIKAAKAAGVSYGKYKAMVDMGMKI